MKKVLLILICAALLSGCKGVIRGLADAAEDNSSSIVISSEVLDSISSPEPELYEEVAFSYSYSDENGGSGLCFIDYSAEKDTYLYTFFSDDGSGDPVQIMGYTDKSVVDGIAKIIEESGASGWESGDVESDTLKAKLWLKEEPGFYLSMKYDALDFEVAGKAGDIADYQKLHAALIEYGAAQRENVEPIEID